MQTLYMNKLMELIDFSILFEIKALVKEYKIVLVW
jgi:hypothetical protein